MLPLFLWVCFAVFVGGQERFPVNILHYNDFHARFVETSPIGGVCNPETAPCIGGFARLTTKVRERLAAEPDSLLLNAGDSFQGTIWNNILRWNVTQEFMNILPHDAHVLGNHEFDNGIEGVVPYLQYLKDPVVTANIVDDDEPSIQGLYQHSIVVERQGRNIGIIGIIISSTDTLASTGNLKFTDEIETVKTEAEKLHSEGVNMIIVLSHCGLDIDRQIALHGGPYIDIIVGGHSHTLLYNEDAPVHSGFVPQGPYPVVVDQDQRKVLIVQAAAHTQYLGEIKLFFDDDGNLLDWEGHPHYIGNEIEQAVDVLEKINYYLPMIDELGSQEIGSTMVELDANCACNECTMGNFLCDAFLDSVLDWAQGDNWHYAHFCVMNRGGIRAAIEPGLITYESTILAVPFENNVEVFDLRGDHIMELLEYSVANDPFPGARMLQVSGLRAVYDGALPLNSRVVNASVRCIECDVPRYHPLQLDKYYKVISQSFMGEGGDGYTVNEDTIVFDCSDAESIDEKAVEEGSQSNLESESALEVGVASSSGSEMNVPPLMLASQRIRTVFDGARPLGERVVNVTVRCIECSVPRYVPLELDKVYKVVSQDFIGNGGGDYTMISENRQNVEVVGVDYDIVMDYTARRSPVFVEIDGRQQISNPCIG